MTDDGYGALSAFFGTVRSHLAPGDRVVVLFGTSGDLSYLRQLVADYDLVSELVARTHREHAARGGPG